MADHIATLVSFAEGRISHLNRGDCPDSIDGHESRDAECPVCIAMEALSHAAGQEVERSRLLCWAFDNLNDMPISDEWASEWCRQAEPHVLAGHPAVARSEGEDTKRLDWLTAPDAIDRHVYECLNGEWCAQDDVVSAHYGSTPREAIDAAILASSGMGGD